METINSNECEFIFRNSRNNKRNWTVDEDNELQKLVNEHGNQNWVLIAEKLGSRSGKQARERYHNHLQGGIKKGDWTMEEDRIICDMQAKIGNSWAAITKLLPGRTDNAVKNRWHAAHRLILASKPTIVTCIEPISNATSSKIPLLNLQLITSSCNPSPILSSSIGEYESSLSSRLSSMNFTSYDHSIHDHEASLTSRSEVGSIMGATPRDTCIISPRLFDMMDMDDDFINEQISNSNAMLEQFHSSSFLDDCCLLDVFQLWGNDNDNKTRMTKFEIFPTLIHTPRSPACPNVPIKRNRL